MKKLLSILLTVIMIFSVISLTATALTSGNYIYIIENGCAIITGYNGAASSVTLPATLGGYPVLAVGEGAFKNKTSLTSVTVPEGVREIRDNAFYSCTNLATINLPLTITYFGENAIFGTAYYNDEANWTIRPESLNSTGGLNVDNKDPNSSSLPVNEIPYEFLKASVLEYIYCGKVLVKCHIVGSYIVKAGTVTIAKGAFKNETGLTKISMSSAITSIGDEAFMNCTSLEKISLVNTNCKIGENAFYNTKYYNDANNWENGIFYIDNRAVLSNAPDGEELVIKDGTKSIGNGAIGKNNAYIPSSVTYIDREAFEGNTSIIYGYSETAAESFAMANGFVFVNLSEIIMGDMDFDGDITANDYAVFHETVSCRHELTRYENMVGDITLDGAVDAMDEIYIQLLINDKTAKVKGDINGDGRVNQTDYVLLCQYIECNTEFVGTNVYTRSDLNGDGAVDMMDAIYLNLYLHGKVSL